jgi:dienelactone hydrolase
MYGTYSTPAASAYRSDYLARPDAVGCFPVVLIIRDAGAISSHIKSVARFLARRGVAVLAMNMAPAETGGNHNGIGPSDTDIDVLAQLDETYRFLAAEDVEWSLTEPVGILGIESGGRLAVMAAVLRRWVGPVGVVYSPLVGDEDRRYPVGRQLGRLSGPVLGIYAAEDERIPAASVDSAQTTNPHGQWLLYENVSHGFMNENHSNYNEAAAKDALARLAGFFSASLPAPQIEETG